MYYITTSRPYTNANPHLGTAIDSIYADIIARFQRRLRDGNVYFTTGTDEHSFKIADKAKELGVTPKEYVDQKYKEFADFYNSLDISSDQFFQNSVSKHHNLTNLVFQKLQEKNLLYKKTYQGLYCKGCEDFYAESQLKDGKCPIHTNIEITKIEEENYFFKLSKFQNSLQNYLTNEVDIPDKSIINEMLNFLENLEDISVSRDKNRLKVDWAVPVFSDPSHVIYVWFEALLTYLTPIVDDDLLVDWETTESKKAEIFNQLKNYLPQDLMVIGRDNSKFHLIILPAILQALDLPLPKAALIHGMITDDQGRKFSKSLGNGIDMNLITKNFGPEGIRYYILREVNPVGNTAFSWDRLKKSYNSTLAGKIGNLLVRLTNLIEKSLDGYIDTGLVDTDLVDLNPVYQALQNLDPKEAFAALVSNIDKINQYIDQQQPWKVKDKEKLENILGKSLKSFAECNECLSLFLPQTAEKIQAILIRPRITKAEVLFPRVDAIEF